MITKHEMYSRFSNQMEHFLGNSGHVEVEKVNLNIRIISQSRIQIVSLYPIPIIIAFRLNY